MKKLLRNFFKSRTARKRENCQAYSEKTAEKTAEKKCVFDHYFLDQKKVIPQDLTMDNIENNNSNNSRTINIAIIMPGEAEIPFQIRVNNSMTTEDILQATYHEWNGGSGKECRTFLTLGIRSLSVHDIVKIEIDDKVEFYQVKPIGWQWVSAGYVRALDAEVRAHEDWKPFHAFRALDSVMWSRKEMAKEAMRIV